MDSSSPLIITGMHRSGTSLLAGFFHRSGIHLGDVLLGASPTNPSGHFEDVEILEFHRAILQREFGHTMWAPKPPQLTSADRSEAEALVAQRMSKAGAWGWKEPRTCLFLDLWDELLPAANYLFVIRHPRLVLDSLGRRNNTRFYHFWVHNRFVRAWIVYNAECLRFYQEHPGRCVLVQLEELLQSPRAAIAHWSRWLGVSLDVEVFQSLYDPAVLADRPAQIRLASPVLYRASLSLYRQMVGARSGSAFETGPKRGSGATGVAQGVGQGGNENR